MGLVESLISDIIIIPSLQILVFCSAKLKRFVKNSNKVESTRNESHIKDKK